LLSSYFDLKTAVYPEKMKIPGECEHTESVVCSPLPSSHAPHCIPEGSNEKEFPLDRRRYPERGISLGCECYPEKGISLVNEDSQE